MTSTFDDHLLVPGHSVASLEIVTRLNGRLDHSEHCHLSQQMTEIAFQSVVPEKLQHRDGLIQDAMYKYGDHDEESAAFDKVILHTRQVTMFHCKYAIAALIQQS